MARLVSRLLLVLALIATAFVFRVAAADEDVEDAPKAAGFGGGAAAGSEEEPSDLDFASEFPGNPFSNVVIGEATLLAVNVTNSGSKNYTILGMAGVLVNANNYSQILRNLSAYRYDRRVEAGKTESMPYYFRVDIDPEDLGMIVIAEYIDDKNVTGRAYAFRGSINVVEPEMHFYDLQAIFLYVVIAAILGGGGYLIKEQFFPTAKGRGKKSASRSTVKKADGPTVSAKVLQDEWIPEHVKNVHKGPGSTSPNKTKRRPAADSGSKSE